MNNITHETIKKFETYLYEEERSENTIEKYMRDINAFAKHIGDKDLKKSDVLEYKRMICERYAPKSVNSILSSLNALFAFMNWYELRVKTLKIQRVYFRTNQKN